MASALNAERINVDLGEKRILSDLSLVLKPGEFVGLLGRSGSGKSTLLKAVVGEVKLASGSITISGRPAYSPQRSPLLPWLTVIENLEIARPSSETRDHFRKSAVDLLKQMDMLDARDKKPHEISGGMRSRASVARAFLMSSDLVVMDEPFLGLDAVTKKNLHEITITNWQTRKPATLFVTHDIDEALRLSNRLLVMNREGSGWNLDIPHKPGDCSPAISHRVYEALR